LEEAQRVLDIDLQAVPEQRARLTFAATQMAAADGADALVIVTEWKAFKSPDFAQLKQLLKSPLVFDGRNLYEPAAMTELGIEYHAIGRDNLTGLGGAL